MTKVNAREGYGVAKPKPITAWAVETDGEIFTNNIYSSRLEARWFRSALVDRGIFKKAHVRKVVMQVVKGR